VVDRGWAQRLLEWRWSGSLLSAEISCARYFIRCDWHEALAWGEVRDPGGRYRVEVGSFPSVGLARGACERDAERRLRRDRDERGPVDVRISRGRGHSPGRRAQAGKGRELPGANYRPRDSDPGAALDAALAAFMPATEDRG
jgi:hypothetical protein